ncbi:MAG: 1,4-alpha-glucan-branching enzyme, partial [Mariniphaga sp.]|nr:1,4-alpha-glucan-branching enzyme [Mariniphaga sp.]
MSIPEIINRDSWLKPYENSITAWHKRYLGKKDFLTAGNSLSDFATGHLFYGLHKDNKGWIIREWAPNATQVYLI